MGQWSKVVLASGVSAPVAHVRVAPYPRATWCWWRRAVGKVEFQRTSLVIRNVMCRVWKHSTLIYYRHSRFDQAHFGSCFNLFRRHVLYKTVSSFHDVLLRQQSSRCVTDVKPRHLGRCPWRDVFQGRNSLCNWSLFCELIFHVRSVGTEHLSGAAVGWNCRHFITLGEDAD